MLKCLAKNTETNRWFDGSTFNIPYMRDDLAKVMSMDDGKLVAAKFPNVEMVTFDVLTADEQSAAEALFIDFMNNQG